MITDILTAAGVKHRRARFPEPPAEVYAVYTDYITVYAPDPVAPSLSAGPPRVYFHDVTVELYEPTPSDDVEAAIEAEISARGLAWTKQDRYWLQEVQRYQVIYELSYITK